MKCQRDLSKKKKMITTMNTKMITNSQLSTTNIKKTKAKMNEQTTRTLTESQK